MPTSFHITEEFNLKLRGLRQALPKPVDVWINTEEDELIILLSDDTSLLAPVRMVGTTFLTMNVSAEIWRQWRVWNQTMKELNLQAVREGDSWQLAVNIKTRRNIK